MSDKPKTHNLNLYRGSVMLLVSMFSQPGWYDNPGDAYRAGELLERPEFDLEAAPKEKAPVEEQKAWGLAEIVVDVTEKSRETMKKAVDFYAKKGGLPVGKYSNRLLRELGLSGE